MVSKKVLVSARLKGKDLTSSEQLMNLMYTEFKESSKAYGLKEIMASANEIKKSYNELVGEDPVKGMESAFSREFGEAWLQEAISSAQGLSKNLTLSTRNIQDRIKKLDALTELTRKIINGTAFTFDGTSANNLLKKMEKYNSQLRQGLTQIKQTSLKKSGVDSELVKARMDIFNSFGKVILNQTLNGNLIENIVDSAIVESAKKETKVIYKTKGTGRKLSSSTRKEFGDIQVTTNYNNSDRASVFIVDKPSNILNIKKDEVKKPSPTTIQAGFEFSRAVALMKGSKLSNRFNRFAGAALNYNRYRDWNLMKLAKAPLQKSDKYLKTLSNMVWMIAFQDYFGFGDSSSRLISAMIIDKKIYTLSDIMPQSLSEIAAQSSSTVFKTTSTTSAIPYNQSLTFYNSDAWKYLSKYQGLKTSVKMKSILFSRGGN